MNHDEVPMSETDPAPAGKRFLIAGVLAVAAAVIVLIGLAVNKGRETERERQSRRAEVKAGPRVPVATASRAPTERAVTLNGEAHPYATVTLYAKVSGYLREIRVDKGDRVARGDLLAVIESPELDRQYDAAVADAKNK